MIPHQTILRLQSEPIAPNPFPFWPLSLRRPKLLACLADLGPINAHRRGHDGVQAWFSTRPPLVAHTQLFRKWADDPDIQLNLMGIVNIIDTVVTDYVDQPAFLQSSHLQPASPQTFARLTFELDADIKAAISLGAPGPFSTLVRRLALAKDHPEGL